MYVSSLLLNKANKDWFQFNRLGAVSQRKKGADFIALYSTYKSQSEAKSRSWQVLSTQGRKWLQKMMLIWVKLTYLQGLQKCCFPVIIKQPAVSSPNPSQPALQLKKAVARPFFEWRSSDCSVLVLCYFLPLSLQSPAPSPTQTGTKSSLPLPPGLALLFTQASIIQLLQELKNLLLRFWRLGTTRELCHL